MDLISHGSWLFDLIDQSGPLSFLDPVSCVVTELRNSTLLEKSFTSTPTARDWSLANCLSFTFFVFYLIIHFTYTMGARDFSSAVSGFCQVFIVTRAAPGFGLRRRRVGLRPTPKIPAAREKNLWYPGYFTYFRPPLSVSVWTAVNFERVWIMEAGKTKRLTVIRQGILFVLYMVRVLDLSHPYTFLSLP